MLPAGVKVKIGERCEYDPETRTIYLAPDADHYARAHEAAHARQHHEQSLIWRAYCVCRWVPVLSWLVVVVIELDALLRVRRSWSPEQWRGYSRKAWACWRSYLVCIPMRRQE